MCPFTADGRCKFGQACRFVHCSEESLANVSESQSSRVAFQLSDSSDFAPEVDDALLLEWDAHSLESGSDSAREQLDIDSDEDSDDSTKASDEDSWSVSTPTGSQSRDGDEGSEHRRRRPQRNHAPTTLLLKNVPEFLTQGALVSQFEDLSPCMRGSFDFFYLPWNPCKDCNLGYAIINFFDPLLAAAFKREWDNKDLTAGFGHEKRLQIQQAILQGYEANFDHFSCFCLAHHENLRFRPLLRASRSGRLQAMAVSPEQVEDFKMMCLQIRHQDERTAETT